MKPTLKKCLGIGVIIIGLAAGASAIWLLLRPSEYQATARVEVKDIPNPDVFSDAFFTECEFQVIASRVVLGRVVEALNLDVEWGRKYARGKTLKTVETVQLLKQRLNLRVQRNTEIIKISVTDEDPVEAAKIANAIASIYCEFRKEGLRQLIRAEMTRLKEASQQEEDDIKAKQENLVQLRNQLNFTDLEPPEAGLKSNNPVYFQAYFQAKLDLTNEEARQEILRTNIEFYTSLENGGPPSKYGIFVNIVELAITPASPIGPGRVLGVVMLLCGLTAFVAGFYGLSKGGVSTNHER